MINNKTKIDIINEINFTNGSYEKVQKHKKVLKKCPSSLNDRAEKDYKNKDVKKHDGQQQGKGQKSKGYPLR